MRRRHRLNDGAALLAEAFRSNLFVAALDGRGYWFRYHHLLRDLLRSELARAEPEFIPGLHARAAAWHEDNGNVDEAIEHAIAAAERSPRPGPPVDVLGTFETNAAFLRGVVAYLHGDVGGAHALAKQTRDGAAPMSDGLASMLIGLTAFFAGDHDGALEPLEHARGTLATAAGSRRS